MVHAVLDANVFVHFKPIHDIDWRMTLDQPEVRLVVCRSVVGELDDLKHKLGSQKQRDRVRRALALIEEWLDHGEAVELREGVSIEVQANLAQVAWDELGLDSDVADDRLVAVAYELERENGPGSARVVTDDTGPRLTAKALGLAANAPLESDRLPKEPDPADAEIRKLRAALAREQTRPRPSVRLVFADTSETPERCRHRVPQEMSQEEIEADVAKAVALAEEKYQLVRVRNVDPRMLAVAEGEIRRYNGEVSEYLDGIAEHRRELAKQADRARSQVVLRFNLSNLGDAPAEDIDIRVEFDAACLVLEDGGFPAPRPPKPPRKPRSFAEVMLDGSSFLSAFSRPWIPHAPVSASGPPNLVGPEIDDGPHGRHVVDYRVSSLKHGFDSELPGLLLYYPDADSVASISIAYSIHCANLREPTTGTLHLIVE